ncbi:MAG: glycosyltransferase family 2 protein [Blautia sp.]|nr:glycosyltransferase family 2 protein [Blautia sp.]
MKKISVRIPCYNEEGNIRPICEAVIHVLQTELPEYDYEIVIIDNKSRDRTRQIIRELCAENRQIKAVFNVTNFGQFNSPFYGLLQCSGDCVISICADFQNPPEYIPQMVRKWEEGHSVVCMIKTSSDENKLMYWLRGRYYKMIKKISAVEQIEQFTGYGLYDRKFVEILRQLNDPTPFIRGIVAEYAPDHVEIPFNQPKRKSGKSHNNFYSLYDAAMLSITSYSKVGMRLAMFIGLFCSLLSFLIGFVYLILKLLYWNRFAAGQAPLLIMFSMIMSLTLVFLGFIGEYISAINIRVMHRPLVIEEERINFTENVEQNGCTKAEEQPCLPDTEKEE